MKKELEIFDKYGEIPVFKTSNPKWGLPVDELDEKSWNTIRKALTPPTADEIVKEYKDYLFGYFYFREEDRDKLKIRYNDNCFEYNLFNRGWELLAYATKGKMVITIYSPLKLAHKITSFFMEVKPNEKV